MLCTIAGRSAPENNGGCRKTATLECREAASNGILMWRLFNCSCAESNRQIRQRDPVFQDDFIPGVDRDPDPERRERRALLKKMRSEKKVLMLLHCC